MACIVSLSHWPIQEYYTSEKGTAVSRPIITIIIVDRIKLIVSLFPNLALVALASTVHWEGRNEPSHPDYE